MSFLLTEINRLREENTYLRWKLDHPNSLAEHIPVVKVGEPVEDAFKVINRRLDHIETMLKRNVSS